ncbi:hypothetical protein [Antricoccus suffuscus]|nr:hypothetical protein [Antricoccus suffuscus]
MKTRRNTGITRYIAKAGKAMNRLLAPDYSTWDRSSGRIREQERRTQIR